jgi:hypothetical protein
LEVGSSKNVTCRNVQYVDDNGIHYREDSVNLRPFPQQVINFYIFLYTVRHYNKNRTCTIAKIMLYCLEELKIYSPVLGPKKQEVTEESGNYTTQTNARVLFTKYD